VRRSTRPNKGEGGSLVQLTNLSAVIEKQPRAVKKSIKDIPLTQGVNPMAPENTKPKRGRPSKKVCSPLLSRFSSLILAQPNLTALPITASMMPSSAPTHLVPPGTEPLLHGPQLAFGHQFGFHPSALRSKNTQSSGHIASSGKLTD